MLRLISKDLRSVASPGFLGWAGGKHRLPLMASAGAQAYKGSGGSAPSGVQGLSH